MKKYGFAGISVLIILSIVLVAGGIGGYFLTREPSEQAVDTVQNEPNLPTNTQSLLDKLNPFNETTDQTKFIFNKDLSFGMQDDTDVKELQKRLASEGCYAGSINGDFDETTREAVKCFQRKYKFNSIPASGYVGAYTRKVLNEGVQVAVKPTSTPVTTTTTTTIQPTYLPGCTSYSGYSTINGSPCDGSAKAAPSPPHLNSAVPGNSQVTLTWAAPVLTGSGAIIGYHVRFGYVSNGSKYDTGFTGTALTYTHTGLDNGTNYYYTVTAVNSAGESLSSNEVLAVPSKSYVSSSSLTYPSGCTSYSGYSSTNGLACDGSGKSSLIISNAFCRVDYTEAPQLESVAKDVAQTCANSVPKLEQFFSVQPSRVPYLIFFKDQKAAGLGYSDKLTISIDWMTNHPNDMDFIPHELTHVIQSYPTYDPSWMVEGIADYGRYISGYGTLDCSQGYYHYTSGYRCTATLLHYIEKTYYPGFVLKVHQALRSNAYSENIFTQYTGKSIDQLWSECLQSDCEDEYSGV